MTKLSIPAHSHIYRTLSPSSHSYTRSPFPRNLVNSVLRRKGKQRRSMMYSSPTAMAPLLVRNLLTSIFVLTDKSLLVIVDRFKILQILRYLLISAFLFLLQILPFFFPSLNSPSEDNQSFDYFLNPQEAENRVPAFGGAGSGDSCIARALSQLLSIINEIPVSSRKYEVVKSLAEKLIADNIREDCEVLSEVNHTVLSAAFARTLAQLEVATMEQEGDIGGGIVASPVSYYVLNRVFRTVRSYGNAAWSRFGKPARGLSLFRSSAEKLAAELLWLAEKLVDCGSGEEAVCRWASASNLAWLALSAGPRLQGSLIKITAFMLKQDNELGGGEECDESKRAEHGETKMKMLVSWLPFLCRASGGVDAPVLTLHEKSELERVLEEIIQSLREEEQERVLTLWLHHFTHCPASDWPNLHSSYERWCTTSRKLIIFTENTSAIKKQYPPSRAEGAL